MSKQKTMGIILLLLLIPLLNAAGQNYNYGEALQKAFFFYEAQQSGVLPAWNRVEWRGDSCTKDYVTGGWYDAGDHVKFGLPMAQSADMLGWAAYEYKSAFQQSGQWDELENNLRFVLNYFVNCHKGNQLVYQVGSGGNDHGYWGVVECIEEIMTRPYYTTNASCVTGGTAAALAIGAIIFNDANYLTHAKQLFTIADTTRSDDGYTEANGFYQSWSGFWDELMWAATWLYIATGDKAYLDKAESYVPNLNKQGYQATDPVEYQWGQCWDDKHYAAMLLLARITGKQEYIDFVEMHLDWWTTGYQGNKIRYTPGGLAFLDTWGVIRYALNTAFVAVVYSDWVTDTAKKQRYYNFFDKQLKYALGTNPRNASYVVGFGNNPPKRPHHRNAHGGWAALMNIPDYHRHILYGALVGGPDANDAYTDTIDNYTTNEVATDYNAGFVACLARAYTANGGTPLADFPQAETRENEIFAEACYNNSYGTYTEIRLQLNNRSGWPPRVSSALSCKYFFDLTEVFAAGITVSGLKASMSSTQAEISAIQQYSGNIYYVTLDFTGTKIFPGGMQHYYKEVQFQVGLASGTPENWNAANDFSFQNMTTSYAVTKRIPVYDNGKLVFGQEPNGATPTITPRPATPQPTATPHPSATGTPQPGSKGDVNGNGTVDIVDALMTAQYYVGLNPQGFIRANADFNSDGSITIIDALMIAQYYVGLIGMP